MIPEFMSPTRVCPGRRSVAACRFAVAVAFVFFSFMATASTAPDPAAPKPAPGPPDVIIFTNGDQLTGKFLRSVGGNAVFHSDIVGDLTVSWDKVKQIHSEGKFVVLEKGFHPGNKMLPAHLPMGSLSVENQQIELAPSPGERTPPIPVKNVAYVVDQKTFETQLLHQPGFFGGWSGSAMAGATIVEATQNTYSFNGGVTLVRIVPEVGWLDPRNRTSMDFLGSFGKITEHGAPAVKTAIYHADAERDEYFSPRFYGLAQAAFDHNFSQSLDLQQIYGGGFGRTLIKRPNTTLDVKATVQYESQRFLQAIPGTNQNLIGSTFAGNYLRKLQRGMVFNQQIGYIPAWNNRHAYSFGETDSLVLPIYKRFSLSLGTIDSYLNDPALTVPPTRRNSFQFTMGIAYTLAPPH